MSIIFFFLRWRGGGVGTTTDTSLIGEARFDDCGSLMSVDAARGPRPGRPRQARGLAGWRADARRSARRPAARGAAARVSLVLRGPRRDGVLKWRASARSSRPSSASALPSMWLTRKSSEYSPGQRRRGGVKGRGSADLAVIHPRLGQWSAASCRLRRCSRNQVVPPPSRRERRPPRPRSPPGRGVPQGLAKRIRTTENEK